MGRFKIGATASADNLRWALYGAALLPFAISTRFPLDDAYITLHNAAVLLTGADPSYGVPALTGATSPVHLALLAGAGLLLPLPLASALICTLSATLFVVGLDVLMGRVGMVGWRRVCLTLLGLLAGTVPIQLFNGLETGMAMAAVCWLLVLADDRRMALLAGVAPFIRPELAVLSASLLLRQAWGGSLKDAARLALLAGAGAAPWILWLLISIGSPVSNTSGAKVAFFAESGWPAERKIGNMWAVAWLHHYAPLCLGAFLLPLVDRGKPALAFVMACVAAAFMFLPGSFEWNQGRYMAVLVPCFVLGLTFMTRTLVGSAVIVLLCASAVINAPSNWTSLNGARQVVAAELSGQQRMLGAIPSGATVLVHDAGIPAWVGGSARLVDVVGLKTPRSAEDHKRLTRKSCKWGPALDKIASETGAQYLIAHGEGGWHCVVTNLRDAGWGAEPEMGGAGRYELYRLTPPKRSRLLP